MKTFQYTLVGPSNEHEIVNVTADNSMDALGELAALGYDVQFPGWWIQRIEIKRNK